MNKSSETIEVVLTREEAEALQGLAEYTLDQRGAWPALASAALKIKTSLWAEVVEEKS